MQFVAGVEAAVPPQSMEAAVPPQSMEKFYGAPVHEKPTAHKEMQA